MKPLYKFFLANWDKLLWIFLGIIIYVLTMNFEIGDLKKDVEANTKAHDEFVTQKEFALLKGIVDRIDQNTQQLYNHFLK